MKVIENKDFDLEEVLNRSNDSPEVQDQVKDIIKNVKERGDGALKEYSLKFDNVELDNLRITEEEIQEALDQVEPELLEVYQEAANNIRAFHEKQLESSWSFEPQEGIFLGQKITPIKEVGMYVPGGKAAYPSTVLMDSIPALVAGVDRLVMVSPPDKKGKINPHILSAASIAGISEIYKVGGAQAIAALAYGTESIKTVSKIVGPGNIYVALAKKEVFGDVAIDMIAGPSEVCIIADKTGKPEFIAADMLAQSEHDQRAQAILITPERELAKKVIKEIDNQLENSISRKEIARESIDNRSLIFIVDDLNEAFELANEIAPEHLELAIKNPEDSIEKIENAGAIFIGENTPEPVGDYFAGPNHTLPTSGTAKFSSPLGVYDFLKRSSLLSYSAKNLNNIKEKIVKFAVSEGLDAHANSIKVRSED